MSTCLPNRARGSASGMSFQEERCWGTVSNTENTRGLDFVNESINTTINEIESQIIRPDRMRSPSQQGNQRPGGDINGELQPGTWGILLKHALGAEVLTSGSGPYEHKLQGSPDLPPGLTMEKLFRYPDAKKQILRYVGGRVNEFFLSVPTEGIVTCRAGMLFKKEVEVDSPLDASPTYLTPNEPFNSFHASLMMDTDGNGSLEPLASVRSMDLLISNNIDGEQFAIGTGGTRADLPEDVRAISGNLAAFFTDENYRLYQAYKANTTLALQLLLRRGTDEWLITVPQIKLRGDATPKVPGRGPLDLSFQYIAHRDDDLGTDIIVNIRNGEPILSTAA